MVAQLKKHFRRQTLIYLSAMLLTACSDPSYTIVELHHKQPSELTAIIDQQLDGQVEFNITGQTIIFYADMAQLKSTVELLSILDKPPSTYRLEFSWKNPNRRSTIRLPDALSIQQDEENVIRLFDHYFHIAIEPINQSHVRLTIKKKEQRITKQEQHYLLTLNQLEAFKHPLLPRDVMIKVTTY